MIEEFQAKYELGMDCFVAGQWENAKRHFNDAKWICPRDKACEVLLRTMNSTEDDNKYGLASTPYVAPEGWPGYHMLTNK